MWPSLKNWQIKTQAFQTDDIKLYLSQTSDFSDYIGPQSI